VESEQRCLRDEHIKRSEETRHEHHGSLPVERYANNISIDGDESERHFPTLVEFIFDEDCVSTRWRVNHHVLIALSRARTMIGVVFIVCIC
jgi:hypothetical protein